MRFVVEVEPFPFLLESIAFFVTFLQFLNFFLDLFAQLRGDLFRGELRSQSL